MKKLFSIFATLLFAGSMMAADYVLVSSVSELQDGDSIIICNADGSKAIGTTQNTNNRAAVDVTVSAETIVPGANVQIIALEADGDNWLLNVGSNKYLYAAGGTGSNPSNYLKSAAKSTAGDNGKFAITMDANGVATLQAQGACQKNVMRYNPNTTQNNPIFSCYGETSATGTLVTIYKKSSGVAPDVAKPVISGETQFFGSTHITISCATEDVYLYYTTDGSDPDLSEESTECYLSGGFDIDKTTTVKAIAIKGTGVDTKYSEVATKVFTKHPSYDSFEDLIAADLADHTIVEVSFDDIVIDSMYVGGNPAAEHGIYFTIGGTAYEIYYSSDVVPDEWAAGGKVSGTIRGDWYKYGKNNIWEIVPSGTWTWDSLNYDGSGIVTALDEAVEAGKAVKVVRDGQVIILRGKKAYNLVGAEL